jgi:hypothetical protein
MYFNYNFLKKQLYVIPLLWCRGSIGGGGVCCWQKRARTVYRARWRKVLILITIIELCDILVEFNSARKTISLTPIFTLTFRTFWFLYSWLEGSYRSGLHRTCLINSSSMFTVCTTQRNVQKTLTALSSHAFTHLTKIWEFRFVSDAS